ncbi:MAG: ABC transporter permease [Clostridia bacterium]|nr:ABC transporter permease [Clostridia bacterium]
MVTRGRALRRKLRRDMRQNLMQFLALMLLCFLGTWVFAGLDANWRTDELTIETWIRDGELCDFWMRGAGFSHADLARVRAVPGVALIQERVSLEAECPDLPGKVTASVHACSGEMKLNVPRIRSGSALAPNDARGCLVEEQFAQAQGLRPGDSLVLSLPVGRCTLTVRGTVLSPEYLITSKESAPDPQTYGFVLISSRVLQEVPCNDLLIRMDKDADADALERALGAAVPEALILSRDTHPSTLQARNYVRLFRNMSYLFPVLAYFVAALVVVTTLSRMMDTQRIQMGTLKALGYSDRRIRRHYLAYALWPSLIGSMSGLFLAQVTLVPVLFAMIASNLRVPEVLHAPISPLAWALAAAEVAAAVLICLRHEKRAARETTAELLRPKPPRAGSRVLLERIPALWRHFSFNAKMIVRNLFRNKGRTFMSLIGMLFCNMLIICSFGLQESIPAFVRDYYAGTLAYDLRVDLEPGTSGTLESYRGRIDCERLDAVMETSVSLRTADRTRTVLLTVLPQDTELLRLGQDQTVMELPASGLVVTAKLAKVMDLAVGDTVEVWLTGESKPILMPVSALADTNIGQLAFMSKPVWDRLRKGSFTVSALLIQGATERGERQIDSLDHVSATHRPPEQYTKTLRFMDSARAAFSILSGVALGLAFIICYNMGLLNFAERSREYATLKVLGYHQREIRRLMLRENSLTAILGVSLGIWPGITLVQIILKMCEFESMVFEAHVSWRTVLFSSLGTYAFTWLIMRLLTRKVKRIDMVEALKSVE